MKFTSLILSALLSTTVLGANIAIIDSGTDYKHEMLSSNMWKNQVDSTVNLRDEDRNGYEDDIYGWNFAESNREIIDYSYLGLLNDDIRKFFNIQAKRFYGEVTEEELEWARNILKNKDFIKRISVYGNFMHGTHVAGITVKDSEDAKVMGVKLIPTEVKLPGQKLVQSLKKNKDGFRMKLLKGALAALAKQQMVMLTEIAYYINDHKMDVANGSFGTGYAQSAMIITPIFKIMFQRDPNQEELDILAKHFLGSLISEGQKMTKAAPNTLFVFAAGNDGLNNDKYPTSPTNIVADNVISVAATIERDSIAPFSNYGKKMVDVAAPGVGINSAVPGGKYLRVSGTSQAAPYVANIAGKLKDINPELRPKEIKKIIMGTVDLKDFLNGKVVSSGIVNTKRAQRAAQLSLSMNLNGAIKISRKDVVDIKSSNLISYESIKDIFVLPLPSPFN